ncbi:MAG: FtsH protease activity modulator HflK [Calditrichia bacterium]
MSSKPPFDLNDFRPPSVSGNLVKVGVLAILLLGLFGTSWFSVEPEEVGIVLRFGKYDRTVTSGLNFKLPFGIESVQKVPVERQLKQEFGFRTLVAGKRTQYSEKSYDDESLMVTGDLNMAEVEWIVQYRVSDPYKYLFRVRNANQTFRDINEAVMREIVGDRSALEVLTTGRGELAQTVSDIIQGLCESYELGLTVEKVQMQSVTPPDAVKPAFNDVNVAEQEREKLVNEAQAQYNRVIPKARGEAQRKIEEARGYALERINEAKGEAARFNAIYAEYSKAREVTKQRMYLETMTKVMKKIDKKFITDDKASGILPLFDFNKGGQK